MVALFGRWRIVGMVLVAAWLISVSQQMASCRDAGLPVRWVDGPIPGWATDPECVQP